MNSNAHAGPLLALLKALGVEATPDGIVVEPRAPASLGAWRLTTSLAEIAAQNTVSSATRSPA